MKDEGANLATLVATLSVVVTCGPFGMTVPYDVTCFGQAMSKAYQYATTDKKV